MTWTVHPWQVARLLVGLVCAALLTSMGGAGIYAAPVTLPLLWLAGRRAGRTGRVLLDVVAVLTAAEVAWAAGYAAGGAWEWVLPLLAAFGVGVLYPVTQRAAR